MSISTGCSRKEAQSGRGEATALQDSTAPEGGERPALTNLELDVVEKYSAIANAIRKTPVNSDLRDPNGHQKLSLKIIYAHKPPFGSLKAVHDAAVAMGLLSFPYGARVLSEEEQRIERMKEDLKSLASKLNRIPAYGDIEKQHKICAKQGEPFESPEAYIEAFGSIPKARRKAGVCPESSSPSEEERIADLLDLGNRLGRSPTREDLIRAAKARQCFSAAVYEPWNEWKLKAALPLCVGRLTRTVLAKPDSKLFAQATKQIREVYGIHGRVVYSELEAYYEQDEKSRLSPKRLIEIFRSLPLARQAAGIAKRRTAADVDQKRKEMLDDLRDFAARQGVPVEYASRALYREAERRGEVINSNELERIFGSFAKARLEAAGLPETALKRVPNKYSSRKPAKDSAARKVRVDKTSEKMKGPRTQTSTKTATSTSPSSLPRSKAKQETSLSAEAIKNEAAEVRKEEAVDAYNHAGADRGPSSPRETTDTGITDDFALASIPTDVDLAAAAEEPTEATVAVKRRGRNGQKRATHEDPGPVQAPAGRTETVTDAQSPSVSPPTDLATAEPFLPESPCIDIHEERQAAEAAAMLEAEAKRSAVQSIVDVLYAPLSVALNLLRGPAKERAQKQAALTQVLSILDTSVRGSLESAAAAVAAEPPVTEQEPVEPEAHTETGGGLSEEAEAPHASMDVPQGGLTRAELSQVYEMAIDGPAWPFEATDEAITAMEGLEDHADPLDELWMRRWTERNNIAPKSPRVAPPEPETPWRPRSPEEKEAIKTELEKNPSRRAEIERQLLAYEDSLGGRFLEQKDMIEAARRGVCLDAVEYYEFRKGKIHRRLKQRLVLDYVAAFKTYYTEYKRRMPDQVFQFKSDVYTVASDVSYRRYGGAGPEAIVWDQIKGELAGHCLARLDSALTKYIANPPAKITAGHLRQLHGLNLIPHPQLYIYLFGEELISTELEKYRKKVAEAKEKRSVQEQADTKGKPEASAGA